MTLLPLTELSMSGRIVAVVAIAALAHLSVRGIRYLGEHLLSVDALARWNKVRTLAGLVTSTLVFSLYFGALGIVLKEFGVSLTAYLASASIIGLAIGFGSQGVVQDVVTGLTVILSDLFQVGDLVEVSGQAGEVEAITMRFTILLNPLGASVFIPNRTISNVIIYPRGYVRCFADITVSGDAQQAQQMLAIIDDTTRGFVQQFPGILRDQPEQAAPESTPSGRVFVRVKFRIWPGRNAPIDGTYKSEILACLKKIDPEYQDWMVTINNEVSEQPDTIAPYRRRIPNRAPGAKNKPLRK